MTRIQEQFERTKRWYKLFEDINNGRTHSYESDYYRDVLYAFFQNFWHLKDWIINSETLDKKIVDDFFHSGTDMEICRDLANGSKHLTIKNPSIDDNISVDRSEYKLSLGGRPPIISVTYWIRVKDKPPIDAFFLAGTLLSVSEGFLRANKLID